MNTVTIADNAPERIINIWMNKDNDDDISVHIMTEYRRNIVIHLDEFQAERIANHLEGLL